MLLPHTTWFLRSQATFCVCFYTDGLAYPVLGSGFEKPLANMYTRGVATALIPLPTAYFGAKKKKKSALLTVAITLSSVF